MDVVILYIAGKQQIIESVETASWNADFLPLLYAFEFIFVGWNYIFLLVKTLKAVTCFMSVTKAALCPKTFVCIIIDII